MSLGFARDSILDLASMSKEHDDSNISSSSGVKGGDSSGDVSSQSSVDDSDQQHDPTAPSRKKNLYFAQNQQPAAQNASEVGLVLGGPPSSTGAIGSAAGSDAGSSAGQSSSSSVGPVRGPATSSKGAYSAFAYDYSAYADYYNESDAWMDTSAAGGTEGGGTKKKKSVFSCLFAPWASKADEESDDDDESDDSSHRKDRAQVGPDRSSSQLEDHGVDDHAQYRGALEVNDSISLAKAKQLRQQDEAQSIASSAVADLPSHAEEKKGDENDDDAEAATGSTASTGLDSDAKVASARTAAAATTVLDDDDVTSHASCGSGDTDVYGEKLTEKDRQAVMARLRLSTGEPPAPAPPPEVSTSGSESSSDHGAPSSFAASETATNKTRVKGILKHTSNMASSESLGNPTSVQHGKTDLHDGPPDRRSLFPLYATRKVHPSPDANDGLLSPPSKKSVGFSPMARVVSVPSRREMTFVDRAGVWWQRSDYDDFKKVRSYIGSSFLALFSLLAIPSFYSHLHSLFYRPSILDKSCRPVESSPRPCYRVVQRSG